MPTLSLEAKHHDAVLDDDEILNLQMQAQALPLSNHAQLRLIATAGELRRLREGIAKMREGLATLRVT